jgi:1,4-alpha-glucan branching enzyme
LFLGAEHAGLQKLVGALNHLYTGHPALHESCHQSGGFRWLDANDADGSLFVFVRLAPSGEKVYVVVNATPVPRKGYRMGVAESGVYRELLNTDAGEFGGSNVLNVPAMLSTPGEWQQQQHSVMLDVPPLGAVYLGKI